MKSIRVGGYDKMKVRWQDIKNGHSGFENLAFQFVQEKFPNSKWKKTKKTRDGNKDAVALIFGYQPYPDKAEQWWMEAKYSQESHVISRYRLDATIVSAILEGNVSKVIFITNILVGSKTIIDIRNALFNAIGCREVLFCSRYSLEHWLSENPQAYIELFDIPENLIDISIQQPSLYITQDVEFFSVTGARTAFKEPLKELHKGTTYVAYFSAFSSSDTHLQLKKSSSLRGLSILSKKTIELKAGENQIQFYFQLKSNYQSTKRVKELPPPVFLLGETYLLPASKISVYELSAQKLNIKSQSSIIKQIKTKAKEFIKKSECCYHLLAGVSGVGKSFILEQFVSDEILIGEDIFFAKFTYSDAENNRLLIDIILFLLFPYINPTQIDAAYLQSIKNNYVNNHIIELINNRNDFEKASASLMHMCDDYILPLRETTINRRIIVMDDLHKLSNASSRFLGVLLCDIWEHKLPLMTVFATQPLFLRGSTFKLLSERCIISQYEYHISLHDISHCFNMFTDESVTISPDIVTLTDLNVVELLIFFKYILEKNESVKNIEDLVLLLKLFQHSQIKEAHLLSQFNNLIASHPECRMLCDKIYWSCAPYNPSKNENEQNIKHLIYAGLISYNDDGCLIPTHDIYTIHYRKHFTPNSFRDLGYDQESPEYIKHSLENEFHPNSLKYTVKAVEKLVSDRKFHSVLFILKDAFSQINRIELSRKFNEEDYYSLFLAYALAAHQQCIQVNCIDLFEELTNETRHGKTPIVCKICIKALWDLALAYYEQLEYKKTRTAIREMLKMVINLQNRGIYPKDIRKTLHYHDAVTIDTLIRVNENNVNEYNLFINHYNNMLNNGFYHRALSYGTRFSLTLCTIDMPLCISLLERFEKELLRKSGNKDKHYFWCGFHVNYYKMIWESKPDLINKVLYFHQQMKRDHYNNYRHRLNAVAVYYYSIGNVADGDRYILKEALFERELYARQKAFHFSTFALREMIQLNSLSAVEFLNKSEKLLRPLDSYNKIILHNINILSKNQFRKNRVQFWFGGEFEKDVFYIDPRNAW